MPSLYRAEYDFSFLGDFQPLARLAGFATSYLESDPNSSLIKQGMIIEYILKSILVINNRCTEDDYPELNAMIDDAAYIDILPKDKNTRGILGSIRRNRNNAVHRFEGDPKKAHEHMDFLVRFCKWFMKYFTTRKADVYMVCERSVPYGGRREESSQSRYVLISQSFYTGYSSMEEYTQKALEDFKA